MKRKMSNELEFDGDMKRLFQKHNNNVPNLLTTIASFLSRKTKFFVDKTDTEWGKVLFDVFNGEFSKAEKKRSKCEAFEVAEKRRQELMNKMEELHKKLESHQRELDDVNQKLQNDPFDKEHDKGLEPGEKVEKPTKNDDATVLKDAIKSHTSNKVTDKKRHNAYDIWFDEYRQQIMEDNPNNSSILNKSLGTLATHMWLNIKDTTVWDEKANRLNGDRNNDYSKLDRNVRKLGADLIAQN